MSTWMRILLSLSLSGALLTLVLLVLSRLLGRRLGRRWQYYVWLIAVLRLLLPIPAPAGLLAPSLPPAVLSARQLGMDDGGKTAAEQSGRNGAEQRVRSGEADSGNAEVRSQGTDVEIPAVWSPETDGNIPALPPHGAVNLALDSPEAGGVGPSADYSPDPRPGLIPSETAAVLGRVLAGVWLAAAMAMLGKKLWAYRRALRLLRESGAEAEIFDEALARACQACGLRRRPQILVSPGVVSPAAVGVLRPIIAMPADFSPDQAYYVFLHEATHIKRQDALYKWAVEIAVCLHWFNPVVRLLPREVARACELSCDEAVLRRLDGEELYTYGEILLDTLRRHVAPSGAEMALPLSENAKWMKERLGAIMGFKTRTRRSAAAAAAVSAALIGAALLCGFAPPQGGGEAADPVNIARKEIYVKQGHKTASENAGAHQPDGENTVINESDIKRRADQKSLQEKLAWKNKYIVALAWNVDPDQYTVKREIGNRTVCFGRKTVQYADDSAVAEAVRQVIEGEISGKNKLAPEELVLLMVDGPFEGTADELTQRFYQENNLLYFTTVIDEAGEETCISVLEQSYEADQMEYFSMAGDHQGEAIREKKKELAKRAARDGKMGYFSILSSDLTGEELGAFALDAYEAGQLEIFYIAAQEISSEQAAAIAGRAYEDDRIEYLLAVLPQMTETQRQALRDRAKKDGKTEFGYMF